MHSEVYAEFSLYSVVNRDFDSSVIATRLGIDPGVAFRVGDAIAGTRRAKRRDAGWELESSLPRSHALREHVRNVLSLLYPKCALIQELVRQFNLEATMCGVVYSYNGDRPPLVLEVEEICQIAELGAGFWIDLYILHDDDEAEDDDG